MEIAPNIHQIRFPINTDVWGSLYALTGDTTALVDAGSSSDVIGIIEEYFHNHNLDIGRIESLVVTHDHFDHAGGTASIVDRLPNITPIMLESTASQLRNPDTGETQVPDLSACRIVDPGRILELGGRRWSVLSTPGHAPGLLSLFDPERKILIATDALQGDGTPDGIAIYSDLHAYYLTIERIRSLSPEMIIVSHPFEPFRKPVYKGHAAEAYLNACLSAADSLSTHLMDLIRAARHGLTIDELIDKIREERVCRSSRHYTMITIQAHLDWLHREGVLRPRESGAAAHAQKVSWTFI